jgi:hypothetical protein
MSWTRIIGQCIIYIIDHVQTNVIVLQSRVLLLYVSDQLAIGTATTLVYHTALFVSDTHAFNAIVVGLNSFGLPYYSIVRVLALATAVVFALWLSFYPFLPSWSSFITELSQHTSSLPSLTSLPLSLTAINEYRISVGGAVAPMLNSSLPMYASFMHVIHRMFPFARWIYEDKVSNFWCISQPLFKWNSRYDRHNPVDVSALARARSTSDTLATVSPRLLHHDVCS